MGFLLAGLAAVFLVVGFRGRRVDTHPVCGKCRFDLEGVYPAITTCPECGSTLQNKADSGSSGHDGVSVRTGNRARRGRFLGAGTAGFIVSIGLLAASIIGVDLDRYKPYVVLQAELEYLVGRNDSARTDEILTEIMGRVAAGNLDASKFDSLVNHALKRQAEQDIPWTTLWGDMIDAYDVAAELDEDRLASYLRRGATESFSCRSSIRSGDWLPVRWSHGAVRLGGTTRIMLRRIAGGTIGGRPLPVDNSPRASMFSGSSSGSSGSTGSVVRFGDPPLEPGMHELKLEIEYTIKDAMGPDAKVLTTWTQEISKTIEVVGADEADIAMIESAASVGPNSGMGGKITVDRLGVQVDPSGRRTFEGTIFLRGVPVPCAFTVALVEPSAASGGGVPENNEGARDVFWENGDVFGENGVAVGSVSYRPPDGVTVYPNIGFGIFAMVPDGFDAVTVDVVFRPDPESARMSLELTEIWGGEVVIKNVPVSWPVGLPVKKASEPAQGDPAGTSPGG